uniref:Uncharacterized protein n=1 Tax=Panstrongylus lignarius TaxID=156445 RepID=A0A224Y297_9HEMI
MWANLISLIIPISSIICVPRVTPMNSLIQLYFLNHSHIVVLFASTIMAMYYLIRYILLFLFTRSMNPCGSLCVNCTDLFHSIKSYIYVSSLMYYYCMCISYEF